MSSDQFATRAVILMANKILYLVSEDWYFVSHRLPMARAAQRAGYEVHVVTRIGDCAEQIKHEGFILHPIYLASRQHESNSTARGDTGNQTSLSESSSRPRSPRCRRANADRFACSTEDADRAPQCPRGIGFYVHVKHDHGYRSAAARPFPSRLAVKAAQHNRSSAKSRRPRRHSEARRAAGENRLNSRFRRRHRRSYANTGAFGYFHRRICWAIA